MQSLMQRNPIRRKKDLHLEGGVVYYPREHLAPGEGTLIENKAELYSLTLPELEALLASWSEAREQARTVWQYLYRCQVTGFEQMTTLPHALQERLAAETTLCVPQVLARQEDPGGETRKDLLQLADGEQVEVVLLRYRQRRSACISTQVGCACGCPFCATGRMGFVRQLSSAEIVAQVLHFQRELAARQEPGQDKWPALSNVVLMGMGEPLLNYEQTMAAVRRLIDQRAVALPPGRVTLSTVGIVPGIERLAQENLPIKLAISLHAATDDLRDELVPINKRYPLDDLFVAVRGYATRTRRRVLIEWVMIDGVNDTPEQAQALVERLAGLPAHANLIRLNPTPDYDEQPSAPGAIRAFAATLDRAGIPHTLRQRRGAAIQAGCGQLRSREVRGRDKGE
jgi:23S rRNA (adenine2503-C2)-methyltransferase